MKLTRKDGVSVLEYLFQYVYRFDLQRYYKRDSSTDVEILKLIILQNTCEWLLLDFEHFSIRSRKFHLKIIFDKISWNRKGIFFIIKLEPFWIYLGTFRPKFKETIVTFEISTLGFVKIQNLMLKGKIKFGCKNALFGYFQATIWKRYWHISNKCLRISQNVSLM